MGPTASGKTDLAVRLREYLPVDIISVDSSQVYRGMDIGTAKPDQHVLARAPHRLIDICDVAEPYSVAEFVVDARRHIAEITAAGRIPLLVGGTMLYFKALLQGLADLPPADPQVRMQIEAQARQQGWPYMHGLLAEVDAATAANLHPNHSQRIARALEVFRITGTPMSQLIAKQHSGKGGGVPLGSDYRVVQLALVPPDRQLLHKLIEQRFLGMLADGLIDEVKQFYERDTLSVDLPSMRAVGYRQVWSYLAGQWDYDEMVDRSIIATRQLAKRQLTWLRQWPDAVCVNVDGASVTCLSAGASDKELGADISVQTLKPTEDTLTNTLNILRKASIYFV